MANKRNPVSAAFAALAKAAPKSPQSEPSGLPSSPAIQWRDYPKLTVRPNNDELKKISDARILLANTGRPVKDSTVYRVALHLLDLHDPRFLETYEALKGSKAKVKGRRS